MTGNAGPSDVGAPAAGRVAIWSGLLDDAALFPPGDAPMTRAVPAHRRHRAGPYAEMVNALLIPAARIAELIAVAGSNDRSDPLDVAVIAPLDKLDDAVAAVRAHPRLALAGIEVAPSAEMTTRVISAVRALAPDVPVAVEVPRDGRGAGVLDTLAGTGLRAKLRTGGLEPAAFPSVAELATSISGCSDRGISFKATAGLHRAVRHTDAATGFTHHGYLNLLLAADVAATGGGVRDVAEALAEQNTDTVAAGVRAIGPGSARWDDARALFGSFGTCSVTEPIADLEALDLLRAPHPETTP